MPTKKLPKNKNPVQAPVHHPAVRPIVHPKIRPIRQKMKNPRRSVKNAKIGRKRNRKRVKNRQINEVEVPLPKRNPENRIRKAKLKEMNLNHLKEV